MQGSVPTTVSLARFHFEVSLSEQKADSEPTVVGIGACVKGDFLISDG